MVDFAQARRTMVDCQIRTSDVTDLRVIAAFFDVARERFVPAARKAIAYLDRDVPVNDTSRALLKRQQTLGGTVHGALAAQLRKGPQLPRTERDQKARPETLRQRQP